MVLLCSYLLLNFLGRKYSATLYFWVFSSCPQSSLLPLSVINKHLIKEGHLCYKSVVQWLEHLLLLQETRFTPWRWTHLCCSCYFCCCYALLTLEARFSTFCHGRYHQPETADAVSLMLQQVTRFSASPLCWQPLMDNPVSIMEFGLIDLCLR